MTKTETIFRDNGLHLARMISWSKSSYREANPENEVYFNANIFVLGEGKVWFGDIDVTKDQETLQKIASEIGKDLFILRELDGRFENETLSDSEIIKRAASKIKI